MSDSTSPREFSLDNSSPDHIDFDLSDYLVFNQLLGEDTASVDRESIPSQDSIFDHQVANADDSGNSSSTQAEGTSRSNMRRGTNKAVGARVVFRTKTELDIMDDGFKWKKYGKKMVKNRPFPRNYYRCSVEGCPVKKRIERDADDPQHVITTYEGIHNHESPSA